MCRPHCRRRTRFHYRPHAIQNQNRRPVTIEELEDRTLLTSLISIDDLSGGEEQAGTTNISFTIMRNGIHAGDLNKNLTIQFLTRNGSATSTDNDYVVQNGSLDFLASNTSTVQAKSISIVILTDDVNSKTLTFPHHSGQQDSSIQISLVEYSLFESDESFLMNSGGDTSVITNTDSTAGTLVYVTPFDLIDYRELNTLIGNDHKSNQNQSPVNVPPTNTDTSNHTLAVNTLSKSVSTANSVFQLDGESTLNIVIELSSPALYNSQQETLKPIDTQVVNLDGDSLGHAAGSTIYIDVDTAGYDWSIDSTLTHHSEFFWSNELTPIALPLNDAAGRIDLNPVIQFELNPLHGYGHTGTGEIQGTFSTGIRLMPDWELNFEFEQGLTVDEADEFFLKIQDETELTPF
tara:strand:+ start:19522 stop:20736 length:1215 start_codon:yes stop_codon:yes gene_type:complete